MATTSGETQQNIQCSAWTHGLKADGFRVLCPPLGFQPTDMGLGYIVKDSVWWWTPISPANEEGGEVY